MKVFDLDGAKELLTLIKPLVEAINTKKEELYSLFTNMEEEEDKLEKLYMESQARELDAQIRQYFQKIEALGGVIKGTDPILIDFLSFYQNRYIWLCWKEDEETILYWHELDEGFAGRKPVELLRENSFRL
ncbi:MAG: DUF2203 domain-containing protein [Hydrogenobacter thermophilus]|uniref:DUF2203 domain-containing protein n=3 Tax=Aquificia TaxID=187857 RepID=D3DKH9_HYDTT|nr:DUF2203 domain-containing protein [Hydrogenobacter thermophilus]ADO46249.1 Protein of unknown function DUF2203 [Hydrogenobacter thermophilus TK-6]QWK19388.1 MAG: DUF2203 domain-containing protein [Hydrogenobacter thermophilus]BAE02677.1 hypothetical protein [Hydrogenobacter thermophilus TK-6]BAI70331.1 hypothetical protein HTH_1887 [Hydrogenobacter thermophilus TK-6]